ncbi:MAG: thiamine-phosphate kinase [Methylophilus sp.]
MKSEFNLIHQYFARPSFQADLGVGDDAALLRVSDGHQLAVSSDMLVAGTHFFEDCEPYHIGWKSLAVNVSDMAAMGAKPKWATLAIALPEVNEAWLAEFSRGFFACADAFNVDLIGGDTTHGPLNISVTIMGEVEAGKALVRSGAEAGDDIWMSGVLGNAALGLQYLLKNIDLTEAEQEVCLQDLHMPQPRVSLGLALSGLATSCIDISDGLLADLSHILDASKLGADIHLDQVACLPTMKHRLQETIVKQAVLAGGDDYELCFTAPAKNSSAIQSLSEQLSLPLTCIGKVTKDSTLNVFYEKQPLTINKLGYDHFA